MNDPISDMITRIRNAQSAKHPVVALPFSKIKLEIAKILKQEKYIEDFKKTGKGEEKILEIDLKYPEVITEIKRVSKPGHRMYSGYAELQRVKSGYGISIVSTSRGLMTSIEARKARLGGEVLIQIW
jgi:small subunit ribosomal protein S8